MRRATRALAIPASARRGSTSPARLRSPPRGSNPLAWGAPDTPEEDWPIGASGGPETRSIKSGPDWNCARIGGRFAAYCAPRRSVTMCSTETCARRVAANGSSPSARAATSGKRFAASFSRQRLISASSSAGASGRSCRSGSRGVHADREHDVRHRLPVERAVAGDAARRGSRRAARRPSGRQPSSSRGAAPGDM